jgi:hypothetical protein
MAKTRVNFKVPIRRTVASRAAYRCSFPDCGKATIGPGNGPHEVTSIGEAAHIFSASAAGPRGQGTLTPAEIGSVDNAIWLCKIHGKLVDNNRGTKFPASLLLTYKHLHEARVGRELGDVVAPFGWIEELEVRSNPLFSQPAVLRFAKANILSGDNGTGKTALCEWIVGAFDTRSLGRWQSWGRKAALQYTLKYSDTHSHLLGVHASGNDVSFSLDGIRHPFNPVPFSVVLFRDVRRRKISTVRRLALQLGVEPFIVRNLASEVVQNSGTRVKNITIRKFDIPQVDVVGTHPGLSYDVLSRGEQASVDLEFAIALARVNSVFRPTLLLVDSTIAQLDRVLLQGYLERLQSVESRFQTVVVTPERNVRWKGWQVIRLEGRPPAVGVAILDDPPPGAA